MSEVPPPIQPHSVSSHITSGNRIIVIGDIHGCLAELLLLLCKCNYHIPDSLLNTFQSLLTEKDKIVLLNYMSNKISTNNKKDDNSDVLVILGDLVNKGPYSYEVVSFVRQLQLQAGPDKVWCIRGNHDDAALQYCLSSGRPQSYSYIDSFKRLTIII